MFSCFVVDFLQVSCRFLAKCCNGAELELIFISGKRNISNKSERLENARNLEACLWRRYYYVQKNHKYFLAKSIQAKQWQLAGLASVPAYKLASLANWLHQLQTSSCGVWGRSDSRGSLWLFLPRFLLHVVFVFPRVSLAGYLLSACHHVGHFFSLSLFF